MESVKVKETYPCDSCEFVSNSKFKLKKHSILHSVDLQKCEMCDKEFANSKGLVLHVAKAHKNLTKSENMEEVRVVVNEVPIASLNVGQDPDCKKNVTGGHSQSILSSNTQIGKKADKIRKKKIDLKRPKKGRDTVESTIFPALKDLDDEAFHHVSNSGPSAFDFWNDGEEDFKLMWLEEMGSPCPVGCHCRTCHPCTKPCCENPAVRSGQCCNPDTLGGCLQPFSPQCFAPCCHYSVQLRDNFMIKRGNLVKKSEEIKLHNPLEMEAVEVGFEEEYLSYNQSENENEKQLVEEIDNDSYSKYVPQTFSNTHLTKYLDKKLGKLSPKYKIPSKDFFKFYVDSSLPQGCRIVHKKSAGSSRVEYFYRSKCGRLFDTKPDLLAYLEDCNRVLMFKPTQLFRNMYRKNLKLTSQPSTLESSVGAHGDQKSRSDTQSQSVSVDVKVHVEKRNNIHLNNTSSSTPVNRQRQDLESHNLSILNSKSAHQSPSRQDLKKSGKLKQKPTKMSLNPTSQKLKSPNKINVDVKTKTDNWAADQRKMKKMTQNQILRTTAKITQEHTPSRPVKNPSEPRMRNPTKPAGKSCKCEDCNITLSLTDLTKHIVTVHSGQKMNRCTKCKPHGGLMNINSFQQHNRKYHTEKLEPLISLPNQVSTDMRRNSLENNKSTAKSEVSVQGLQTASSAVNLPKSEPATEGNARANTSSSDLNDSVETLDKIENFLNNSAADVAEAFKNHHKTTSTRSSLTKCQPNAFLSRSTPPISKINKKQSSIEKATSKKSKSTTRPVTSSQKRSRTSTRESYSDSLIKDTDPSHPTSSFNLRLKGRTHKGYKKLVPMGCMVHYKKHLLDETTTINDVVKGEIMLFKYTKPELYFSISAAPYEDPIADNDERHPTNSFTLRKKGRDHKGTKLLQPFPPMLIWMDGPVVENMLDLGGQAIDKDRYFKISSSSSN